MSLLKNFKSINDQIQQIQQQLLLLQNEQNKVKQEIASETRSVLTQIIHKSSSYDLKSLDDADNIDLDKILLTLGDIEKLIISYREKISVEQISMENIQQKSLIMMDKSNTSMLSSVTEDVKTQEIFSLNYKEKDKSIHLPSAMDMIQEIQDTSLSEEEMVQESKYVDNTSNSFDEIEPTFEPEEEDDPNIMPEEIMEAYSIEEDTDKFIEFFAKNKQSLESYLEQNTIDDLIEQLVKKQLPSRSLTKDRVRYFCIVNQIHLLPHVMN